MLESINLENILFLDIETVPMCADFDQMPDIYKKLWRRKAEYLMRKPEDTPASIYQSRYLCRVW